MILTKTYRGIWYYLLLSKLIYMFLALFVYARFVKLGDTARYIAGPTYGSPFLFDSTRMMDFIAHGSSLFLGSTFGHVPFVIISAYGLYYPIKRLTLTQKQSVYLLVFLSLPSFGIWTSIASKEAVSVFFMGIILGFIIDVINKVPRKNYVLVTIALYLCFIFKPQYLSGIVALLIYLYIVRKLRLKALGKLFVLILFFISSLALLYIFRYEINEMATIMPKHFSVFAGSTRDVSSIWSNDFDIFWQAPYGMLLAFIGPTASEAFSKATHLIVWLESLVILTVFFYMLIIAWLKSTITGRINIFVISLFLTVTLWILFVNYPFGVLNSGSAIRYRQNFYSFLLIFFFFLYSKAKYKNSHHQASLADKK